MKIANGANLNANFACIHVRVSTMISLFVRNSSLIIIESCHLVFGVSGLLKCLVCDDTLFHATCGRLAGVSFEFRNWPDLTVAVCPDHNDGNGFGDGFFFVCGSLCKY